MGEQARVAAGPAQVLIGEVGLRDGLQSEPKLVPAAQKIAWLERLVGAGLQQIEVTSFVAPRAVPQLADAETVMAAAPRGRGARFLALVPNARGAARAVAAGADELRVFLSASETHNRKNVNRPIAGSLAGFAEVMAIARTAGIPVSASLSTVFGCPFEGEVPLAQLGAIATELAALGMAGLALGDTTGMATPRLVAERCRWLARALPDLPITLHFHNTRGLGLVNVMAGLDQGITRFESSLGGLGGCPFAPGATGNVCTEDLAYLLEEQGLATGLDLDALCALAREVEQFLGHPLPGQLMKAGPRLRHYDPDAVATATG